MAEVEENVHVTVRVELELDEVRLVLDLLREVEVQRVVEKLEPGARTTIHTLDRQLDETLGRVLGAMTGVYTPTGGRPYE